MKRSEFRWFIRGMLDLTDVDKEALTQALEGKEVRASFRLVSLLRVLMLESSDLSVAVEAKKLLTLMESDGGGEAEAV